ncbi:cytochrome P450 [Serendipita vermifera]|nr:cytochrome P450 [Serendipita vermifera]
MPVILHLDQESFITFIKVPLIASAILGAWVLLKILYFLTRPLVSPLRKFKGPKGTSPLFGSMHKLMDGDAISNLKEWEANYGHVYTIRGVLGHWRCITTDPKAVSHILTNHFTYYKPDPVRFHLSYFIGNGLVSAEGNEHRNQRRIMIPAFSSAHIRGILPIFLEKSAELRDVLQDQVVASPTSTSAQELPVFLFLKGFIPPLRLIDWDYQARQTKIMRRLVRRIGLQLIEEKQKAVIEEKASAGGTVIEKKGHDRDLLSLMIKSNMSTTVSPAQRLSKEQILNQIPTFLIAGHETTSTATSWCLFALSQHPEVQSRLRQELLEAFPADNTPEVTVEALNALPYFEAVVRETLRFYPPVDFTARVAQCDDIIPLSKPFEGADGVMRDHIQIKKGDQFMLPINLMNRMKEVWGPDGDQYNPDRWLGDLPPNVLAAPGVWANLMTFIAGQRSCIGFKFALLEMKALLYYLVRSFEFELAVRPEDVSKKELIVTRPFLRYEEEKGPQLPMIIKPISTA